MSENEEFYSTTADDGENSFDEDDEPNAINDSCEMVKRAELHKDIVLWSFENNVPQNSLKKLFSIVNKFAGEDVLPKDPRSLLKTPRTVEIVQIGEKQQYWHYGLKLSLENLFCKIEKSIKISLNFNMDGLPIYSSSKDELWLILFNITEFPNVKPMVIGIYHGVSKASSLENYLRPMVDELKSIMENVVIVSGHKITVTARCFICDSPARAFIKGNTYYEYV